MKLFFPPEGATFDTLPPLGPGGPVFHENRPKPIMRDYTPHHFDPVALTLQIDFSVHGWGPVTAWALGARAGDRLIVGGPRGSFILHTDFDWHLLAGDDTALPAIRKRVAELPHGSRTLFFAEVDGPDDEEPFADDGGAQIH